MKYRVLKNVNKGGNAKWEMVDEFDDLNGAKKLARTFINGNVYTEPSDTLDEAYFGNDDMEDDWDSMIEEFDY